MKVARNTTHNLRHNWLKISDECGKVEISLLTLRAEICVDVSIDGKSGFDHVTPRQLAEALLKLCSDPHEKI